MKVITYAPEAMHLLNGFFCVYKPCGIRCIDVISTVSKNLARDLNSMQTRSPRGFIAVEGSVTSGKSFSITVRPNLADHPLVVGPRYQNRDIRLGWINPLGKNISGVFVLAVNGGCKQLMAFQQSNFLRTFEIKGKFGFATDTFFENGKVIEKTTYSHIKQFLLDRTLASIQASHQALAFQYCGVSFNSQTAYELASKGIVRPAESSNPIIYGIHCTEFNLPDFTLQINCINENEEYLAELVHQIGIYVRSTAVCRQIRQIQFGNFTLDHALIRKHWNIQCILTNIIVCKDISDAEASITSTAHFKPVDRDQIKESIEKMQEKYKSNLI